MKPAVIVLWSLLAAGQAFAETEPNAVARLMALEHTDPELFDVIRSMAARAASRSQVAGGFSFEVRDAALRCDEIPDAGFDSCTIAIDLQGQSFASSPDNRSSKMEIECRVDLETRLASGFSSRQSKTESASLSFYGGGTDSDSLTVRFNTYAPSDPVVHAEMKSVDCEITGVR